MRERLGGATAFAGLRVHDIVIEGRANTPEPLLRAALGVTKGDPILGFSLEQARAADRDTVLGGTRDGRAPAARHRRGAACRSAGRSPIWQNQGKFVLIDRAGQVVANEDVGEVPQSAAGGRAWRAGCRRAADRCADRTSRACRSVLIAAVRVGERRWNLQLNNGADVMLPEGHEVAALDRLMQLQQDHALLDRPLAAIDMRLPDRLVLRPRPPTPIRRRRSRHDGAEQWPPHARAASPSP